MICKSVSRAVKERERETEEEEKKKKIEMRKSVRDVRVAEGCYVKVDFCPDVWMRGGLFGGAVLS